MHTRADEALALGRGVCQDFAHLMLAACRCAGLPARYVSGYLYDPNTGDNAASHAWVDVWDGRVGWLSLDPTHGRHQTEAYVRVAVGRDYADVPPTRGVFKGDGARDAFGTRRPASIMTPMNLARRSSRDSRRRAGRRAGVWPDGKQFAFTIFDDTDLTTVANGKPVYDFLSEIGMRITKSVWVLEPDQEPTIGGTSCEDPDYLEWVRSLRTAGHEIALHNVASVTSTRERTLLGFDRFREFFGEDPRSLANHFENGEGDLLRRAARDGAAPRALQRPTRAGGTRAASRATCPRARCSGATSAASM